MDSLTQNAFEKDRTEIVRKLRAELREQNEACWCQQVDWDCETCESRTRALTRLPLAA